MTDVALPVPRGRASVWVARILGEAGIGLALVVLVLFFLVRTPDFGSVTNLSNIATQITLNTIVAVGMTFVILVGGIDLSVGSVVALCAVISGTVLADYPTLGVPTAVVLAVLTSVGVGVAVGLVNGFVTERWRVPSFIVTLGMLYVARGAALQFTEAKTIYTLPPSFTLFGTSTFLGVPSVFVVALALVVVAQLVLSYSVYGRLVLATGTNEEVVRLAGHRTSLVKISVFAISGLCVGIAAIIYMARLGVASPILGAGYELNAIAAVILGGASLFGGKGSLVGTLLGACLLGVLTNGLLLLGVSDFQRQMVTGTVIVVAVVLDSYRQRLSVRAAT